MYDNSGFGFGGYNNNNGQNNNEQQYNAPVQPVAPTYQPTEQPVQPTYQQPVAPQYTQPAYTQPVQQPVYQAPVEPVQPVQPVQPQYQPEEVYQPQVDETPIVEEEVVQPSLDEVMEEDVVEEPVDPDYQPPVSEKKPGLANIVVCGIGGGGNNAVNTMIRAGIKSATFVVMNTDMQALNMSLVVDPKCRIQLGAKRTNGLGAGADPDVGRQAAEESRDKIKAALQGIDLLFITAGMGGGTGTGAAPIVAEIAKSMGILTIAVVTKPFNFEGQNRMRNAEAGIKALKNFVDTILIIPNQKLIDALDRSISFKRAFEIADDVLRQGIQSVSDVITHPELINLDFADIRTILSSKGLAHMGIGYGKGENRVVDAVRGAVSSPLLETDIQGATGVIVNITGGEDMLLGEVSSACDIIKQVIDPNANIIFGTGFVPEKTDIEITIIATGFEDAKQKPQTTPGTVPLQKPMSINTALGLGGNKPEEEGQYNGNLFANQQSRLSNNFAANTPEGLAQQQPRPAQPQQPQQYAPQPQVQQPKVQEPETSVESSRISVGGERKLPAFLQKLRKGRE